MFKKFKRILRSVREYKKYAILTPIFMVGEAALECAMPFIMGMFVDGIKVITTPNDFFASGPNGIPVFYLALILLGMAIVSLLCGIYGGKFASIASVGLAANLRSDLYKKLTKHLNYPCNLLFLCHNLICIMDNILKLYYY